jgi:general secretion pathway protein G
MLHKTNSQKGFTLIELLIVIAVIGILAAIVLATIDPIKRINQAKDARAKSDMGQIVSALQQYFTDSGTTGTAAYPIAGGTAWTTTLINASVVKTIPLDPNGKPYNYIRAASGTSATLCSPLFDATGTYANSKSWVWTDTTATLTASVSCP